MNAAGSPDSPNRQAILYRIAPGLGVLATYHRDWLKHDLIAGVSVAAVALPTAIAYAEIIGLDPVIGLYTAIPALLAYAPVRHVPPLDRESGRSDLRNDWGNAGAIGWRRFGSCCYRFRSSWPSSPGCSA